MEDNRIIELFFDRDEEAIRKTQEKYGAYCYTIAFNILNDESDSKECENDTYMRVWNLIPPQKPDRLSAFLGKITRNIAIDRYRKQHSLKRGSGTVQEALDELCDVVSGNDSTEDSIERKELVEAINSFLDSIPKEQCDMFVMRYWYSAPISKIADLMGESNGNISVKLHRIRKELKEYLVKRGFEI